MSSESSSGSDTRSYVSKTYEERCEIEVDNISDHAKANWSSDSEAEYVAAYADEPLADEVWIAEYRKQKEEEDMKITEYRQRLEGSKSVNSWCTCAKCDTALLVNYKEAMCCREIEGCVSALKEEKVVQKFGKEPLCVTDHPGFEAVCLNIWSLNASASLLVHTMLYAQPFRLKMGIWKGSKKHMLFD